MTYDRKTYERLIYESPLFSLDKGTSEYSSELYRLTADLYRYLLAVDRERYEPYGYEIVTVAARCARLYDSSAGSFLTYFMSVWKKEYSHIVSRSAFAEKYRGMTIPDNKRRNILKYLKLAKQIPESGTEDSYEKLAAALGVSVEKIREAANTEASVFVDDLDGSLWEHIPDKLDIMSELENKDSLRELLDNIDKVFSELRESQKPIVADIITGRIWQLVSELGISRDSYSFISREILDECKRSGRPPLQKSIARKYDRSEVSVSRTMERFVQKIKQYLKGA